MKKLGYTILKVLGLATLTGYLASCSPKITPASSEKSNEKNVKSVNEVVDSTGKVNDGLLVDPQTIDDFVKNNFSEKQENDLKNSKKDAIYNLNKSLTYQDSVLVSLVEYVVNNLDTLKINGGNVRYDGIHNTLQRYAEGRKVLRERLEEVSKMSPEEITALTKKVNSVSDDMVIYSQYVEAVKKGEVKKIDEKKSKKKKSEAKVSHEVSLGAEWELGTLAGNSVNAVIDYDFIKGPFILQVEGYRQSRRILEEGLILSGKPITGAFSRGMNVGLGLIYNGNKFQVYGLAKGGINFLRVKDGGLVDSEEQYPVGGVNAGIAARLKGRLWLFAEGGYNFYKEKGYNKYFQRRARSQALMRTNKIAMIKYPPFASLIASNIIIRLTLRNAIIKKTMLISRPQMILIFFFILDAVLY